MMTKTQTISYINNILGKDKLTTRNTTFASISIGPTRTGWWMNIRIENFKRDWNLILLGEEEIFWLQIPANTFTDPHKYFRIWESKNAADLLISSDPRDRYFKDISSGSTGVDFKTYIIKKFSIPEDIKVTTNNSIKKTSRKKSGSNAFNSKHTLNSEVQKQELIKQGQTNISYENLFGSSLKGADMIELQDPWIRLPYQFNNLLEFCVMLGNINESNRTIDLKVVSWNTEEFLNQSKECFEEIASVVQEMGINLTYTLEKHHDRYIEANNGNKIILGRGLDIFEKRDGRFSIGDVDQKWRKCKPCEITYLRT